MLKRLAFALSCASLPDAAPAVAQLSILTLGDSITQGGAGLASYRAPLINLLNSNGYAGQFQMVGSMSETYQDTPSASAYFGQPNHEGRYGWRADQILNGHSDPISGSGNGNLLTWLTGYTPDVVLIHLGTNDAIQDADKIPEHRDPNFASTTWNDISSIVQTIQGVNSNARIFVAQIIPVREPSPNNSAQTNAFLERTQERIDALNFELGLHAPSLGTTLVDFSGFNPTSAMLADSFHPNAHGELFMANQWFNAMENAGVFTAIPEPSTYALIAGAATLACVAFRRKRARAARAV